jgi:hypothetical protein|tara:strand:+ start:123 stop:470 length:348 start_codon:yes stop_codon:yes gene_type:complete
MKPIKITKIEIHKVEWELNDIGPDENARTITPVYNPGNKLKGGTFVTNIYTDVGVIGTYPLSVDISGIAPYVIGKNPLLREELFNGMVDVPSGPGVGVDWNWDAIKRMKTGTKIF